MSPKLKIIQIYYIDQLCNTKKKLLTLHINREMTSDILHFLIESLKGMQKNRKVKHEICYLYVFDMFFFIPEWLV